VINYDLLICLIDFTATTFCIKRGFYTRDKDVEQSIYKPATNVGFLKHKNQSWINQISHLCLDVYCDQNEQER